MADTWLYTLASVGAVSLISLAGALTLMFNQELLRRSLLFLISLAAGGLLGDAFLHLLPEATENADGFGLTVSFSLLAGVVALFLLEKLLHWHHSHLPGPEVLHPVAVTNLMADAIHNFIDGVIVAGSFLVSVPLGLTTSLAVGLHEIPQELGDFGILVHAGLKPRRALGLNFLTALTAVLGAVITLALASSVEQITRYLIPLTAGAFVYVASTDLLPELHKEPELRKSSVQLGGLVAGIGLMAVLLPLD